MMMNTGSFRLGASSKQSTLSHLAPPFTSNRSGSNPIASPRLGPIFDHYIPSHTESLAPLPDSFAHFSGDIGFARDYDYLDQSIGRHGTHLPCPSHSTDGILYENYSQPVGNDITEVGLSYLEEPSTSQDSNPSAVNESDYVLLNSGMYPSIEGYPHTAYVQSSTRIACSSTWAGQWNDIGVDLSWQDSKGKVIFPHGSSLQPGELTTESCISKKASHFWHEKLADTLNERVYDGSSRNFQEWIDPSMHSRAEENASFPFFNESQMSSVSFPTTMPETKYSHGTDLYFPVASTVQETIYSHMLESLSLKPCSSFNQNTVSDGRCFTSLDSCTTEPTVCYSSVTTPPIRFPSVTAESIPSGSSSSLWLGELMLKNIKFSNQTMNAFDKIDSIGQVSVKAEAPSTSTLTADVSDPSDGKKQYGHLSLECTYMKDLSLNQKKINNKFSSDPSEEGAELNLSCLKIHEPSVGGPVDSLQSSGAFDQSLSTVDSPCWRGNSLHSSFNVAVAEHPKSLNEEPGRSNDLIERSHIFSIKAQCPEAFFPLETRCSISNQDKRSVDDSSFTMKNPSVVCSVTAELELDIDKKAESDRLKNGNSNGAHCADGLINRRDGPVDTNNSPISPGLATSDSMHAAHEKGPVAKVLPQKIFEEPGISNNAAQDRSSGLHPNWNFASIPSYKGGLNETDENLGASDISHQQFRAMIDASTSILVESIHSQSELLKIYSEASALKENDYEVIHLTMNNLSSILRRSPTLNHKGSFTRDTPQAIERSDDLGVGGHQSILCSEETMQLAFCGSSKEMTMIDGDGAARSDKINFDDNAAHRATDQHISDHINGCRQASLLKSLWMETEAELCPINCKFRLARLQIKMEKSKHNETPATDFQTSSIISTITGDLESTLTRSAMRSSDWIEESALEAIKSPMKNNSNRSINKSDPGMNRLQRNLEAEGASAN